MEQEQLYQKVDFVYGGQFSNSNIEQKAKLQKSAQNGELQKKNMATQFHEKWNQIYPVGPGFTNLGNTCFMNAVLQCLTYTPQLSNYLLGDNHAKECKKVGKNASNFCCVCLFQEQLKKCFPKKSKTIQPLSIVRNMRYIFKRFRLGRQEDSHEFLLMLLESLQRGALPINTKLDNNDTISKIFNGKLKSQIKCMSCNYKSEIFENFLDLSLDIRNSKDLDHSLQDFFKVEHLNGKNKYKCSGCKKHVNAEKRFLINEAPNVLTCHFKRFTNSLQKLNKPISFTQDLNLKKFVCPDKKVVTLTYNLYAILVHAGGSCFSGHYYCYVKNSNGVWYNMDDSMVVQTSLDKILREKAYMLFYTKKDEKKQQDIDNEIQLKKVQQQQSEQSQKKRKDSTEGKITQQNVRKLSNQQDNEQNSTNLVKNLGDLQKDTKYKTYMEDLDKQFNLNKNQKKEPLRKNSVEGKEQKIQEQEQQKEKSKVEVQKQQQQQKSEEIEEEYQVQDIVIPGDISMLRPLKKSKLKRRRFMAWMEDKFAVQQSIRMTDEKNKKQKQIEKNKEKLLEYKKQQLQVQNEKDEEFAKKQLNLASQLDSKVEKDQVRKIVNFNKQVKTQRSKEKNWDDADEEIIKEREQIQKEDESYFAHKQAKKDQYDVDYDKGKVKKIKKFKEKTPIDFQQLYESNKNNQVA